LGTRINFEDETTRLHVVPHCLISEKSRLVRRIKIRAELKVATCRDVGIRVASEPLTLRKTTWEKYATRESASSSYEIPPEARFGGVSR